MWPRHAAACFLGRILDIPAALCQIADTSYSTPIRAALGNIQFLPLGQSREEVGSGVRAAVRKIKLSQQYLNMAVISRKTPVLLVALLPVSSVASPSSTVIAALPTACKLIACAFCVSTPPAPEFAAPTSTLMLPL